MSELQQNQNSDAELKFPQINNGQRGDSATNGLNRKDSFEARNKSQGPSASFGKTPFAAKKERVDVEKDANMLANRIALLKQEEMRTWKKIEETKKRASDVMRLKQRNNERVAQKIEYAQEKEFEKKMMVEQNMRMRLMNQQEKEKIIQAIKDSKAEEAAQAKLKAQQDKSRLQQQMQHVAQKNTYKKQAIQMEEQIARQKIEEAKRRKIQETRMQIQQQIEKELESIAKTEQQVMQMEMLEMELIKKLQTTQAIQKQAYMELEAAIQQKGGERSQIEGGGAPTQQADLDAQMNNTNNESQ